MHKPSFAAAVMFLLLSPIVPSWATPSPAALADSPPPPLDAPLAGADDDRWQTAPITLLLDAAITLELPEGYRYLSPADYARRAGVAFSPGMPGLIHYSDKEMPLTLSWHEVGHYPPASLRMDPAAALARIQGATLGGVNPVGLSAEDSARYFTPPRWLMVPSFD